MTVHTERRNRLFFSCGGNIVRKHDRQREYNKCAEIKVKILHGRERHKRRKYTRGNEITEKYRKTRFPYGNIQHSPYCRPRPSACHRKRYRNKSQKTPKPLAIR